MQRTTFILGAGFSKAAGFPLVRELRECVIDFIYANPNTVCDVHLHAGQGFENGQFAEGISQVGPDSRFGFEELLNALQLACKGANRNSPCYVALTDLKIGCLSSLFWNKQNKLQTVPNAYKNFARRFFKPSEVRDNAVVSFNWDLVMEKSLQDSDVLWLYSISNGQVQSIETAWLN